MVIKTTLGLFARQGVAIARVQMSDSATTIAKGAQFAYFLFIVRGGGSLTNISSDWIANRRRIAITVLSHHWCQGHRPSSCEAARANPRGRGPVEPPAGTPFAP